MTTPSITADWASKGLDTADFFAQRFSKDPTTKVGAAIMNRRKRFVGVGYNGFPDRTPDDPARLADREAKLADTIHAEVNAVLNSTASVEDGVLFVTHPPCGECAKFVNQAGIREVHFRDPEPGTPFSERWAKSIETASDHFRRARIPAFGWDRSDPPRVTRRLGYRD